MLSLPVILAPKAEKVNLQSRLASYISHLLGLWIWLRDPASRNKMEEWWGMIRHINPWPSHASAHLCMPTYHIQKHAHTHMELGKEIKCKRAWESIKICRGRRFLNVQQAKISCNKMCNRSPVFLAACSHAVSCDFTEALGLNTQHMHFTLCMLLCYRTPTNTARKTSALTGDNWCYQLQCFYYKHPIFHP